MTFADRLAAWERPLTLYEVIPPPRSAPREEVADAASFVRHLLSEHEVDAINIPEIRNEERTGNRVASFLEKVDPRAFALTIRDVFGDDVDLIVNHPTVYEDEQDQRVWFEATYTKFGIENIVLVGGESSDVDYPGPGPNGGAKLAHDVAARAGVEPCLGAITIPSRRREDLDEPERMLGKIRHGISFFTSQVIYEAEPTRRLLLDYDAACAEAGIDPAPVFLSFAPISGRKDAEFLEWLGVDIPAPVRDWVLSGRDGTLDRSVRVCEHLLKDLLDFSDRRGLDVPVGVNVEHIMRYNFEASEILLDRLSSLLEFQELERRHRTD